MKVFQRLCLLYCGVNAQRQPNHNDRVETSFRAILLHNYSGYLLQISGSGCNTMYHLCQQPGTGGLHSNTSGMVDQEEGTFSVHLASCHLLDIPRGLIWAEKQDPHKGREDVGGEGCNQGWMVRDITSKSESTAHGELQKASHGFQVWWFQHCQSGSM